ncbi:MAG: hypothetical protein LBL45_00550 [Treponema sp.]|nr:hypothetical protein [Treponema sp.]
MKKIVKSLVTVLSIFVLFFFATWLAFRFLPYPELAAFQKRDYSLVLTNKNSATLRVFPAQDGVKREWMDYKTFLKAYETCLSKRKTNGSTIIEAGGVRRIHHHHAACAAHKAPYAMAWRENG